MITEAARMAETRTGEGRKRVIETLDEELIARIDAMAEAERLPRSKMIEWILEESIGQFEDLVYLRAKTRFLGMEVVRAMREEGEELFAYREERRHMEGHYTLLKEKLDELELEFEKAKRARKERDLNELEREFREQDRAREDREAGQH
jgi:predicted transcriptional regulator